MRVIAISNRWPGTVINRQKFQLLMILHLKKRTVWIRSFTPPAVAPGMVVFVVVQPSYFAWIRSNLTVTGNNSNG